jgi:lipooligosaccharide transport system ATP-binding protein
MTRASSAPSPVPPGETAVRARSLTKRFGDLVAVAGIDFDIPTGRCYGFLGPNGAGKTTTVRMIHAAVPITDGRIEVFGLDVSKRPREVKALIGVSPQEDNLDPDFTPLQNLTVHARYFGIPRSVSLKRAQELLAFMQLTEKSDEDVRALSGGMKRRLILARSLVNEPRLLILDEPTVGLDPQARHQIWDRLRELRASGVTILITTHYMEEAAQLCDQILVLDGGRVLVQGSPADLIRERIGQRVVEVWGDTNQVRAFADQNGLSYEEAPGRVLLHGGAGEDILGPIRERFPEAHVTSRPATLEDVFLKLTGRDLRE